MEAAAGAGSLGDVFTITLRGRFERRGFGTAGDVAMVPAARRGASEGAPCAGATEGGLALVLAGRGIETGPAGFDAPAGGLDTLGAAFGKLAVGFGALAAGGDALTAGRGSDGASDGTAAGATCGLGLLEPFDAWAPDSGASFGALLIV